MKVFITGGSGFVGGALIRMLAARGDEVIALARSEAAAAKVQALGATPARGDLDDVDALEAEMRGCQWVMHAAAKVDEWGEREAFVRVNVEGTRHVLEAAQRAGVARVVHVSTEAVLLDERPLIQVDEQLPRALAPIGFYAQTKALAEEVVLEACARGQDAVIVRPRFIWGAGDTTLLPRLVEMVEQGRWAWLGGALYHTSTCHVLNCCHGIICAAQRGQAGQIYFITDGQDVETKRFISAMMQSQGAQPKARSLPLGVARAGARGAELMWRTLKLKGAPPLTRMAVELSGREVTVRDEKARQQLGYLPIISHREGLEQLGLNAQAAAQLGFN